MSENYSPEDQPTRQRPSLKGQRPASERIPGTPRPEAGTAQQTGADRAGTKRRRSGEGTGLAVPWWAFAVVIMVVAGLTCGLWGFVLMSRGDTSASAGPTPTPIFVVITATPTLGPSSEEMTLTPDTEQLPPQGAATDIPLPGLTQTAGSTVAIQVGHTVTIIGTEGDGLSIRQGPGLDFVTFFIGYDGEIFLVQDGPREADGYVWWYLVDPNDADRSGWSVTDFLEVVNP